MPISRMPALLLAAAATTLWLSASHELHPDTPAPPRQPLPTAYGVASLEKAVHTTPAAAAFVYDIPLPPELQAHVTNMADRYCIPQGILLAIMEHESGFAVDPPDNINADGSRDRGLMQINEVNWGWLHADHGLDVADPFDNIEAGALILAALMERYPPEQALVAYQCGEGRMTAADITSTTFSRHIIDRAQLYTT